MKKSKAIQIKVLELSHLSEERIEELLQALDKKYSDGNLSFKDKILDAALLRLKGKFPIEPFKPADREFFRVAKKVRHQPQN